MNYSMSLNVNQKQGQSLKQSQRLIMSPQMQQAINLLQLPVLELAAAIETEMERNPVLEWTDEHEVEGSRIEEAVSETSEPEQNGDLIVEQEVSFDSTEFEIMKRLDEEFRDHFSESEGFRKGSAAEDQKLQTFLESSIQSEASLYEHLMSQARQVFHTDEQLHLAELIIGNLNDQGFLEGEINTIALMHNVEEESLKEVVAAVQTFEPYGVGAKNLRESLLVQLRCLDKQHTLAYAIIESCYEDLIHNRIPQVQKKLECTAAEVKEAVEKHIAKLDLHPGAWHAQHRVQHATPDVTIVQRDGQLAVDVNENRMRPFRINNRYLDMLGDEHLPLETKEYIRNKVLSGKWLRRNIDQRNDTIIRIAEFLIKKQEKFFLDPTGQLNPLTMKAVAEELELHESTIARAVSNKYINSPRGLLPLRSFFTNSYANNQGQEVSANTVKDSVLRIIQEEEKAKPLSDDAISKLIKEKGISCARRTVAKYRQELGIGNTSQRKEYS